MSSGYSRILRIHDDLCKERGINSLGRAILFHIIMSADHNSATYSSTARRLGEESGNNRIEYVRRALSQLRKSGLLIYSQSGGNRRMIPYYVPFFLIQADEKKRKYRITRPWDESVRIAIGLGVIPVEDADGLELEQKLTETGANWIASKALTKILTKEVDSLTLSLICGPDKLILETIAGIEKKFEEKSRSKKRPPTADELEQARLEGIKHLENIKQKLSGDIR